MNRPGSEVRSIEVEAARARTTTSNKTVAPKAVQVAPQPKNKTKARAAAKPETVGDSEEDRAIGGMRSDEDDSLERDVALASPVKGSEFRKATQVCPRYVFPGIKLTDML